MTNVILGILGALGVGAWVYSKIMKSTGGNTQNAVIVAAIAGGATFLLAITLLGFIPD